jgi:lambda family phage portal protein
MRERKTSWFDRALLSVAPQWAARREKARAQALAMRSYDAAALTRRTADWLAPGGDANTAIGTHFVRLRQVARETVRNVPIAVRARAVLANNVIGPRGLLPVPVGVDERQAKIALDAWREWADSTACDVHGRMRFRGLMRLAFDAMCTDGEGVGRWRHLDEFEPPKLQLLEAEYIEHTKHGENGEAGPIILGVEHDGMGRRAAYHMHRQHPGSTLPADGLWKLDRVPASSVLHLFHHDRPGQVRGVTWFAPVLVKIRDLQGWSDAEMMRKWTSAMFSVFVVEPQGVPEDDGADYLTGQRERLSSGTIEHMPPGKDIRFAAPTADAGLDVFAKHIQREIAMGIGPGGITYELATGDLSQVNFSSIRTGLLSHWQVVEAIRDDVIVPQFCDPAWVRVQLAQVARGRLREVPRVRWIGQPMPLTNPTEEIRAKILAVRGSLSSLEDAQREMGSDPDELLEELARDFKRLEAAGVVSDSNPSQTNTAGAIQSGGGATSLPSGRPTNGVMLTRFGPPPVPADA